MLRDDIQKLRSKHPTFCYEDFSYNIADFTLTLNYTFTIEPDIVFKPQICIHNVSNSLLQEKDIDAIDNFAFHLGLMEIPSYWKTAVSPFISIKAGKLTPHQVQWWHKLLIDGMGQFYYENAIDPTHEKLVQILPESNRNIVTKPVEIQGDSVLVPVGGGKDSTVTLELLKNKFSLVSPFIVTPASQAAMEVAKLSNRQKTVSVTRTIDPQLLKMNKQGYLNGHTPYSGVLAFISVFTAYLFGYSHIAFSNELSSNEENTLYHGKKINHQYSKSLDFENMFRAYNETYLSKINYFSFLRPLYELQIAKLFSNMEKYFSTIKSCNIGQKTNSWCLKCPKCLSTFLLLYPFLGERILEIFPKNLFEDLDLFPLLESMTDETKVKPLECVGTREETKVALFLSIARHKEENMPKLLKKVLDEILSKESNMTNRTKNLLISWGEEHNLQDRFETILKKVLHDK